MWNLHPPKKIRRAALRLAAKIGQEWQLLVPDLQRETWSHALCLEAIALLHDYREQDPDGAAAADLLRALVPLFDVLPQLQADDAEQPCSDSTHELDVLALRKALLQLQQLLQSIDET